MSDTPLDLTGGTGSNSELSVEEIEARMPRYMGMGGFDPEQAESGEDWFFAPSLTQTLTAENMEGYLKGEKTLAELYGLTALDMFALAEVGCGYFREAKYHEAHKVFELLVALNPKHAWFRNLLGTTFLRLDMTEAATMQYHKAIEIDPGLVEAWVNVADIAITREEWDAALVAAQHALDIAPAGKNKDAVARAKVIVEHISKAMAKVAEETANH
ncbi:MAG: hypothetical protein AAF658_04980 [Myxococcota bacterium]